MNEGQRNILWKTLALLALPVGILVGGWANLSPRPFSDPLQVLVTVCVAGALLGAAAYIKEGGSQKRKKREKFSLFHDDECIQRRKWPPDEKDEE